MVIFHSYVSLPEGTTIKAWMNRYPHVLLVKFSYGLNPSGKVQCLNMVPKISKKKLISPLITSKTSINWPNNFSVFPPDPFPIESDPRWPQRRQKMQGNNTGKNLVIPKILLRNWEKYGNMWFKQEDCDWQRKVFVFLIKRNVVLSNRIIVDVRQSSAGRNDLCTIRVLALDQRTKMADPTFKKKTGSIYIYIEWWYSGDIRYNAIFYGIYQRCSKTEVRISPTITNHNGDIMRRYPNGYCGWNVHLCFEHFYI